MAIYPVDRFIYLALSPPQRLKGLFSGGGEVGVDLLSNVSAGTGLPA